MWRPDASPTMAGWISSFTWPSAAGVLAQVTPPSSDRAIWMWLFPERPSFHATNRLLPTIVVVGNSRLRMYLPGPRKNRPVGSEGVTASTVLAGDHVLPPSSEREN